MLQRPRSGLHCFHDDRSFCATRSEPGGHSALQWLTGGRLKCPMLSLSQYPLPGGIYIAKENDQLEALDVLLITGVQQERKLPS